MRGDTISSGNWIIDNLNSSLETWNSKLSEIWTLLTTSPENFKGGGIWNVIVGINDALKAIAYALLVLFFVIGVMKTCGSFTELKRPEVAFKCFIRFVLAQAAVTYGMELMTALFSIAQGAIQTIMGASGLSAMEASTLPAEIASTIEDVGLLESIPLWAVTLLGSLFIWVLSLVMILTVYGRFFKLYIFLSSTWRRRLRRSRCRASQDSPPAASAWRSLRATPPSAWRAVSFCWPVLFSRNSHPVRLS